MIRFLYNAGSPQTRELLKEYILQDLHAGEKALLLVPEQETVSVERRMLEHLPGEAQLSFEVLNFSRLADRTFRALGGLTHRAASPAVTALLMWRTVSDLLASDQLVQYAGKGVRATALCELMLQTEAQCKACCISAQDMRSTEQRLPEEDPLRAKLHDIARTMEDYTALLSEKSFDNTANEAVRLAGKLASDEGKDLYKNTHVYVDSFTDFTAGEMAVLAALFSVAPSVTVTFPLTRSEAEYGKSRKEDGGDLHLNAVHRTHRRLLAMGGDRVKAVGASLEPPTRAHEYLARHLFCMNAPKAPEAMRFSGDLRLTPCMNPFDEADAAATEIHRLVRSGCRYRDITVVVRESERWLGILDAALEREGIPFFISEKTDVTLRPLIKLILESLRICLSGWREENVVGYLKTGLCGVSGDDLNQFEEYVRVCHPRGEKAYTAPFTKNPDGFSSKRSERGKSILEGANRVRERAIPPLTRLFAALEGAENATAMCRALYEFLEELGVCEILREQAGDRLRAGNRREAGELSRLYNITVDALEDVATALGDRKLSVEELADALKLVFARTDIGSIPTATDEVTVGSASMLRADHPKFVLVLGLNEGLFPKAIKDDGLLSDADKRRYRELNPDKNNLFTENAKLASDELFFLYRAFGAPTEGLRLFYSAVGTDGRKLSPSIAVTRVHALFDGNRKDDPYNAMPALPYAGMPAHCRLFTRSGAMELLPELAPTTAAALIRLLKQEGVSAAEALTRPVVERSAQVDPTQSQVLFQNSNRFSPTHLEAFTKCRFGYYCDKVLQLRGTPDESVNAAEVGNFIHHVLEHVMLTAKQSPKGVAVLFDRLGREALIQRLCREYRERLEEVGVHITPRTEALFDRLTDLARIIVVGLVAEFEDSKFTPAAMELNLRDVGKGSVTLTDGTEIPLSGQVDRVDVWKKDESTAYLRVTDYKTGNKTFCLEDVEKGFCLQMPLYLMALCRDGMPRLRELLGVDADTKLLPAGVCYFSSAIDAQKTSAPQDRELAMLDALDGLKRSGVIHADSDVQEAVSASRDPAVLGGDLGKRVTLTESGFCDLFATLEATVGRIAAEMKSGAADATPVIHDKKSPCDYCSYAAVCRARKKTKE